MSSVSSTKHTVRLACRGAIIYDVPSLTSFPDADRVAEYDMKLMDIDADTLGIPDTEYDARVTMLAGEFTRIVRDLSSLGESVRIEVSKEGVRFASDGEAAQGNILLKQTDAARERYENYGKDDEEDDVKEDSDEEEKPKKTKKKEKEKVKAKVKKEEGAGDEDEEMANADEDEAEFKAKSEDEDEDDGEEDGEEEVSDSEKKKRKRAAASSSVRPSLHCLSSQLTRIHRRRKRK